MELENLKRNLEVDSVEYGRFLCVNNKILYLFEKLVVNVLGKRILYV